MDIGAWQERLRAARDRSTRAPAGRGRVGDGDPAAATMRVALGADHGGFALKEALRRELVESGYDVVDCGTASADPVDYPDFAAAVARAVARGDCARGVVIDAAGLGSCMAANKVRGVRAATCHDEAAVRNSRLHNDANVLALGARAVHPGLARRLVRLWLATPFEGGRHQRRLDKIAALEAAP
jgi:ribose 5-phosphate isomerase B